MKIIRIGHRFHLRSKLNSTEGTIYCRIIINRKKSEFSTGYTFPVADWDEKSQRCIGKSNDRDFINHGLAAIETEILRIKNEYQMCNKPLSAKKMKEIFRGEHETRYTLLDFAQKYLKTRIEQERGKVIHGQIKVAIRYLEDFLAARNLKEIMLEEFNRGMLKDFETYLQNTTYGIHNQRFKVNTIHKYMSKIRSILLYAEQYDLLTRNPFNGYRLRKQRTNRMGLEFHQIRQLAELDLTQQPANDITRDCFLFCCFTGVRFEDMAELTPENVHYDEYIKAHVLSFVPNKTKLTSPEKLSIPLVDTAEKIITKYSSHPLTSGKGRLLPSTTNQKTNLKLKHIQAMLNWHTDPITFHLSRHTLSSCLANIGTNESVQARILGHARSTQTAQYTRNISLKTMLNYLRTVEDLVFQSHENEA